MDDRRRGRYEEGDVTVKVERLVLAVLFLGACGGNAGSQDAGTDLRGDATQDAPVDVGVDAPADVGVDAPADVGVDAPADVGVDAPVDVGVDAPVDVGVDAPPDLGADLPMPVTTIVFDEDFEVALPSEVDPGTAGLLTPTEGFASLGPTGNQFGTTFLRSPSGSTVTVTLTGLPPHTSLSLAMLFGAIDSLDGTIAPPNGDFFRIELDGVPIFRESFANALVTQTQSYDPPPAVVLARREELGFGPSGLQPDSAYDFGADPRFAAFPHSSSTAVLTFVLEGLDPPDLDNESWALDNLRIAVTGPP